MGDAYKSLSPTTKGTIQENNGGPRYTPYTRLCVYVCVFWQEKQQTYHVNIS